MLAQIPGVLDLSLSTNGLLLPRYAEALKRNGLKRVNISLDTLQPHKFRQISPVGRWEAVWAGIEAALATGLHPVKINCVLMRGINDDEILGFAQLTLRYPLHVRFIELMPIGNIAFRGERRSQPLHALYRREIAPRLEETLLASPSLPALQVVIRTLRLRLLTPPEWQTLDPEGISFRNWNTPD